MKTDKHKLDERNHVEKPLLDQLSGLGWGNYRPDGGEADSGPYLPRKFHRSGHAKGPAGAGQGDQPLAGG